MRWILFLLCVGYLLIQGVLCVAPTGMCGILWMLSMRYFLIARHRQRHITMGVSSTPVVSMASRDSQSVPWISLFTKPAFWSAHCLCLSATLFGP